MTALQKIKSLFKRPKVKDKVEQPKATVAPEKKGGRKQPAQYWQYLTKVR